MNPLQLLSAFWQGSNWIGNGVITTTNTTQSTSTTTGSIITAGGVGIAKNLFVGGTGSFTGSITGVQVASSFSVIVGATTRINFKDTAIVWNESATPAGAPATFETGSSARFVMYGYPTTNTAMSIRQIVTGGTGGYTAYRANGTIAAPTAVISGEALVNVGGGGYDGTAWSVLTQGLFRVVASENWSNVAHGTKIELRTTPNGATLEATAVIIEHDKSVTIAGALTSGDTFLMRTTGTLANGAAALTATLTNSPVAGNPTKWLSVNDNGVTRYVPAW